MDLLHLSQNIRTMRIAQGMTVEQLAVKSGFSKGFVSQVENFRTTPSLKALNKLAEALGMAIADLFMDGDSSPEYSFGNLNDGEELVRDDNLQYGMRYFALAYRQIGREMNPFVIEYTAGEAKRPLTMHDAEEFFVLLEGEIEYFILNDDHPRHLKSGDTVYMKANLPHRVELSPGCRYAKALIVYAAPNTLSPSGKSIRTPHRLKR